MQRVQFDGKARSMRTVGSPPTIRSVRKIRRGTLTFICPACALRSKPQSRGRLDDQALQVLLGAVRVPTFAAAAKTHAKQAVAPL